ncbi:MAG: helix-turn-helix transcriptional regulator [Pseudobutyrivibrio sp.]|nr:helix-turn-helix transcriptional regulator [Pseudobutyrivibrio sp.]
MARPKKTEIEYRNYLLPAYFPILLLSGDIWRISDIPSGVLHFHNCLEIGRCESDSGTMEFLDQKIDFKEGDITIIAKDVPHTTYSTPGKNSKWSYIFVNIQDLMAPYFPLDLLNDSSAFNTLLLECSALFSREKYPDIYNIVSMIIDELIEKKDNFQFSVRGLILSLMIKLSNLYVEKNQEAITTHENSMAIAPAINFIRTNYMEDFPMEDLAAICNMSPTHFRRTFHSIMGFGSLEYVNRIRITHAQNLLRTTEKSILSISEDIGFQSVSSFNRHFNEIVGMTPTQYRNRMSSVKDRSILKCTGWMVPPPSQAGD